MVGAYSRYGRDRTSWVGVSYGAVCCLGSVPRAFSRPRRLGITKVGLADLHARMADPFRHPAHKGIEVSKLVRVGHRELASSRGLLRKGVGSVIPVPVSCRDHLAHVLEGRVGGDPLDIWLSVFTSGGEKYRPSFGAELPGRSGMGRAPLPGGHSAEAVRPERRSRKG